MRNTKTWRVTKEDAELMAEMYARGYSLRLIGDRLGVRGSTVLRTLEKMGVPRRSHGRNKGDKGKTRRITPKQRESALKYLYGLTMQDVQKMLKRQHYRCAICRKQLPHKWGKGMAIDHDHQTGEVRGILCSHCNTGIGMFKDNPETTRKAARYLELHTGMR